MGLGSWRAPSGRLVNQSVRADRGVCGGVDRDQGPGDDDAKGGGVMDGEDLKDGISGRIF